MSISGLKPHRACENRCEISFVCGFSESAIDMPDGLINFRRALEANHDCIEQTTLHGKAYGLLAVLRLYEIAVAYEFHADDAVIVLAHDIDLLHRRSYVGYIARGVPAFCGGVNVGTLRINANEIDIDPIELRGTGLTRSVGRRWSRLAYAAYHRQPRYSSSSA